jgi:predicted metal-dependent hydrolase
MRDGLLKALENRLADKVSFYAKKFDIAEKIKIKVTDLSHEETLAMTNCDKKDMLFDLKLLALCEESLNTIVIHELTHIKIDNGAHTQEFWDVLKQYDPKSPDNHLDILAEAEKVNRLFKIN